MRDLSSEQTVRCDMAVYTTMDRRTQRATKYFGDLVDPKRIRDIISNKLPPKKEVDAVIKEIMLENGYTTLSTMNKNTDEYRMRFK